MNAQIVACARCLAKYHEADIGTLIRLAGGDPDNDDYFCIYEDACDDRMGALIQGAKER